MPSRFGIAAAFVPSAVLLCFAAPLSAQPSDPLAAIEAAQIDLFKKTAPSVVYIVSKDKIGSGFAIAADLILTNAHVVAGQKNVDVILLSGAKISGIVDTVGANNVDLALVRLPQARLPFLTLAFAAEPRVGMWVGSVGHGSGGGWTFTQGMISNIYPFKDRRPVFQTQIPLNPGNSGGPVFDRNGNVLGVVTAGIKESNSINFAIRVGEVCLALPSQFDDCPSATVTAPDDVAIFVDGKLVGKGPKVNVFVTPGMHEAMAVIGTRLVKAAFEFPTRRLINLVVLENPPSAPGSKRP